MARVEYKRPAPLEDVLEEHLDSLEFLLGQRRSSLRSLNYTLRARCDLEERILAHHDALVVASLGGRAALLRALLEGTDEQAASSMTVFLALDEPDTIDAVLTRCAKEPDPPSVPFLEAFRIFAGTHAIRTLLKLGAQPEWSLFALDVAAFRRLPITNIGASARSPHAGSRAVFWRAAARAGFDLGREVLEAAERDPSSEVRDAAYWAAAWRGEREAASLARQRATGPMADCVAIGWLGALGDAQDLGILAPLAEDPALNDVALEAIGRLGAAEGAQILLSAMQSPARAHAAALGFHALTGIALPRVKDVKPSTFEGEFEDPLPDVQRAEAVWRSQAPKARKHPYWRCGREASPAHLFDRDLDLLARHDITVRHRALAHGGIDLELEGLERGERPRA